MYDHVDHVTTFVGYVLMYESCDYVCGSCDHAVNHVTMCRSCDHAVDHVTMCVDHVTMLWIM